MVGVSAFIAIRCVIQQLQERNPFDQPRCNTDKLMIPLR